MATMASMRLLICWLMCCGAVGCERPAASMTRTERQPAEPRDDDMGRRIRARMERERAARQAEDRAILAAEQVRTERAERLAESMKRYILHRYCDEPVRRCREEGKCPDVPGVRRHPELACRINARQAQKIYEDRDLLGWAYVMGSVVDERQQRQQWVPFGADDAAAWLAAVSYHEYSWTWRSTKRGGIGERCAFQVTEAPIELWRQNENVRRRAAGTAELTKREAQRIVTSDPLECTDAAIDWMHHCGELCGGLDARGFLELDESRQPRRRWRNVVVRDGETSRRVPRFVVVPTGAARWMGAYAAAPIRIKNEAGRVVETRPNCGGAPDVVRERFETAYWLQQDLRR